jgi:transcriptional regulator with PAS, ATPase and Fis domain
METRDDLTGEEPALSARSPAMREALERADAIARSDASVLLMGESGTGKELVARRIHERSARAEGSFVAVNCAAFPDTLIEEELFGHERGAFTGAIRNRVGRFKTAHGGTLFLDEVAELSTPAQAKLLRVLQTFSFEPVGSDTTITVDVRLITATHRDLREQILRGRFREDLYYRIKVVELRLPALRERPEDLPFLFDRFLARFTPDGGPVPRLTPDAAAALHRYPFPGNVRELEHAIEHAVVMSRGCGYIDLKHLPADITGETPPPPTPPTRPLAVVMKEFEKDYLLRVLRQTRGARAEAAALLGISRKTLWEKLKEHGISLPEEGRRR